MEKKSHFHHALKIQKEVCIGCAHCMTACPTEAIRIKDGKARLFGNRCIDCGECYRVCPVEAIIVAQDDFKDIFHYKTRVALVPSILIGQFPENVTTSQIYSVLYEQGFTHVFEAEQGAEILPKLINKITTNQNSTKPYISSFCPAIVRLIQVKFPSLVDHILQLKAPVDISAIYYKKMLMDEGIHEDEIGIFYVTPCAAKIAAVKDPVGEEHSFINGVINMDSIYNRVYTGIKRGKEVCTLPTKGYLTDKGISWSLTHGEASYIDGRVLAIDGIHNVIEFLEKIENGELSDIDYLELRACDESCAGGVLTSGNRFLTAERLNKRTKKIRQQNKTTPPPPQGIDEYRTYLESQSTLTPLKPRSMLALDHDMTQAMKKMEQIEKIITKLPNVDCGLCGSPTCHSLAEDIVQGHAEIERCIFIQKQREYTGEITQNETHNIMKKIWGIKKIK